MFLFRSVTAGLIGFSAGTVSAKCADKQGFATCLDLFISGECNNGGNLGCDRTCGMCVTSNCYDVFPAHTDYLWIQDFAAQSEWPSWQNDGANAFPELTADDDSAGYPFDTALVSQICLDVFNNNACADRNLVVVIDGVELRLDGYASEYCKFSCGQCTTGGSCWSDHNDALQYFTSQQQSSVVTSFWGDGLWGSDDESEDGDEFASVPDTINSWGFESWGSDEEAGNEEEEEAESILADDDGWGFGGWGDIDWSWRKRRSFDVSEMKKSNLLTDAILNLIPAPTGLESAWPKRSSVSHSQEGDFGQRAAILSSYERCWASQSNEWVAIDGEAEGEEEEEETEDAYERVQYARQDDDRKGINKWIGDNSESTAKIGECTNRKLLNEIEATFEMELDYDCSVLCKNDRLRPKIADREFTSVHFKCRKKNAARNTQGAADCEAPAYCSNGSCWNIHCFLPEETAPAEDEEVEYENEEAENVEEVAVEQEIAVEEEEEEVEEADVEEQPEEEKADEEYPEEEEAAEVEEEDEPEYDESMGTMWGFMF